MRDLTTTPDGADGGEESLKPSFLNESVSEALALVTIVLPAFRMMRHPILFDDFRRAPGKGVHFLFVSAVAYAVGSSLAESNSKLKAFLGLGANETCRGASWESLNPGCLGELLERVTLSVFGLHAKIHLTLGDLLPYLYFVTAILLAFAVHSAIRAAQRFMPKGLVDWISDPGQTPALTPLSETIGAICYSLGLLVCFVGLSLVEMAAMMDPGRPKELLIWDDDRHRHLCPGVDVRLDLNSHWNAVLDLPHLRAAKGKALVTFLGILVCARIVVSALCRVVRQPVRFVTGLLKATGTSGRRFTGSGARSCLANNRTPPCGFAARARCPCAIRDSRL